MSTKLTLGQRKRAKDMKRRAVLKRQIAKLLGHKRLVRPRRKQPLGNVPFPIEVVTT